MEMQTRIKNKIHSVLFKTNSKHEYTNLYGVAGMNWLKALELRPIFRDELNRYLLTLDYLGKQIKELSDNIENTAKADYDCKLLMTIPGISFSRLSSLNRKSGISVDSLTPINYAPMLVSFLQHASADKIGTDGSRNGVQFGSGSID